VGGGLCWQSADCEGWLGFLLPLEGEGGPEGRMRGLLPGPVCPVISGLLDAGVSHPSSGRLRRPPSPSRGEGVVGYSAGLGPSANQRTSLASAAIG